MLRVPMIRIAATVVALAAWLWGLQHWPRSPEPYGPGFWAWAAGLILLWLAWALRLPPTVRSRWRAGAVASGVAVVALAAAARFYRVTEVPFAVHFDEVNGLDFVRAMHAGKAENVFGSTTLLGPSLMLAPEWLLGLAVPDRFAVSRYLSAWWGTASIVVTWLLARRTHGEVIALGAAALLATSYWHFTMSRFQPLFLQAAFGAVAIWWGVARACSSGRVGDGILSGLIAGICLQFYDPVKVVLAAIPLWWLWHAATDRAFRRRTAAPMAAGVAVAAMVMQPMLDRGGSEVFFRRTFAVTALGEVLAPEIAKEMAPTLGNLADNAHRLARVATGGAALAANHPTPDPLVTWPELAAMSIGLLAAARRMHDWRMTFAPIWLMLTCLAVFVSSVPEAGYRLAVALPAFAIVAVDGAVALVQVVRRLSPRHFTTAAVAALALIAAWNVSTNVSRARAYLQSMNRSNEFITLARAIAAGPADSVYYVEAPRSASTHYTFRALTGQREVVSLANLTDQVPSLVRPGRAAVFALPYWTAAHSLPHLQSLYTTAVAAPVLDPSGFAAGQQVRIGADDLPKRTEESSGCGLLRVGCTSAAPVIDPYVAFLEAQDLCGDDPTVPVDWYGTIAIPDPPPHEIGLRQTVGATVAIGGSVFDSSAMGNAGFPVSFAPGTYPIHIAARPADQRRGVLWLWWANAGEPMTAIPCSALRPPSQ